MALVPISFGGRNEVLQLLSSGEELLFYFIGSSSYGCPVANSKIRDAIGKGAYGTVYTFEGDDGNAKDYVVKVSKDSIYMAVKVKYDGESITSIQELAGEVHSQTTIPEELFIILNGGDESKVVYPGDVYYTVKLRMGNVGGCIQRKPITIREFLSLYVGGKVPYIQEDTDKIFTYPKGSYLCASNNHSEYILGLIASELPRNGVCHNFIDVFGFSMCIREERIQDYVFMERIDGDVNALKKMMKEGKFSLTEQVVAVKAETSKEETKPGVTSSNVDKDIQSSKTTSDQKESSSVSLDKQVTKNTAEEIVDSLYIQILFALSAIHRTYGIQHNDLHTGNVFYKLLPTESTKYIKYHLDGADMYVPNKGYLAMLGDFGLSVKFSEPMLSSLSATIEMGGEVPRDIPGWRNDSYDILFLAVCMFLGFGRYSRMVCKIFAHILDPKIVIDTTSTNNAYDDVVRMSYISKDRPTPLFSEWYNVLTARPNFREHSIRPWDILKNPNLVGESIFTIPEVESKEVMNGGRLTEFYNGYSNTHTTISPIVVSTSVKGVSSSLSAAKKREKIGDKIDEYMNTIDDEDSPYEDFLDALFGLSDLIDRSSLALSIVRRNATLKQDIIGELDAIQTNDPDFYGDAKEMFDRVLKKLKGRNITPSSKPSPKKKKTKKRSPKTIIDDVTHLYDDVVDKGKVSNLVDIAEYLKDPHALKVVKKNKLLSSMLADAFTDFKDAIVIVDVDTLIHKLGGSSPVPSIKKNLEKLFKDVVAEKKDVVDIVRYIGSSPRVMEIANSSPFTSSRTKIRIFIRMGKIHGDPDYMEYRSLFDRVYDELRS